MASARVEWEGLDVVLSNTGRYPKQVEQAVIGVGEYFAPQIETDMKVEAPWTDRTANARQGLWAAVMPDEKEGVYAIHAAHSVYYGLFLELANQGRYAIILKTVERYYGLVMQMLKDVLK